MTDPGVAPAPFVPKAWPVRRFVLGLVVLGAFFAALRWSGLVAPRLSSADPEITVDRRTGRATMELALHNQGPLPVQVHGVTVADDRVRTGPMRLAGSDTVADDVEVSGGGVVRLVVDVTCDSREGAERPRLRVVTRSSVGLERARPVGSVALPPACGGREAPR